MPMQVTTIDACEHNVYVGSLDGALSRWDLRAVSSQSSSRMAPERTAAIDGSAVLRCALGACPGWAAVSTLDALYYLDAFDASTPAGACTPAVSAHTAGLRVLSPGEIVCWTTCPCKVL